MSMCNRARIVGAYLLLTLSTLGHAATMRVELRDYVLYTGEPRANYFDGRLLTARDLSEEQQYQRSADRYIGESTLSLAERFVRIGTGSVVLSFDEADALFGKRTEVSDAHDRYAEDFVVLDERLGTWQGRLYLDEAGAIEAGIYDDLRGRFDQLSVVPVPAMLAPFAFASLCLARRSRRHLARARARRGNSP